MGNTEHKPTIFCNQASLPVDELGHQINHKTFGLVYPICKMCWGNGGEEFMGVANQ